MLPASRDRWSSYRANGLGQRGGLLTPHALYLALGVDDSSRCEVYRDLFGCAREDSPLTELRMALNQDQLRNTSSPERPSSYRDPGSQSSSSKPSIRWNSRRLLVTRIAPSASAWAAINRSMLPIGVPTLRRLTRMRA